MLRGQGRPCNRIKELEQALMDTIEESGRNKKSNYSGNKNRIGLLNVLMIKVKKHLQ
jgi:hypothetical protein